MLLLEVGADMNAKAGVSVDKNVDPYRMVFESSRRWTSLSLQLF
jgi:hypothetical protein